MNIKMFKSASNTLRRTLYEYLLFIVLLSKSLLNKILECLSEKGCATDAK